MENWVVQTQWSMRSGLLMMNPLRRDFRGFLLPWWRKWGPMWSKCWKWVLSTLVKAHGVTPSLHRLLHRLLQVECKDQKDLYPLPHLQEAIESLIDAGYFSCLDLKSRVLADCHGQSIKAVYCLHNGKPRIFQVWMNALWVVQCPYNLPEVNAELPRQINPNVLF